MKNFLRVLSFLFILALTVEIYSTNQTLIAKRQAEKIHNLGDLSLRKAPVRFSYLPVYAPNIISWRPNEVRLQGNYRSPETGLICLEAFMVLTSEGWTPQKFSTVAATEQNFCFGERAQLIEAAKAFAPDPETTLTVEDLSRTNKGIMSVKGLILESPNRYYGATFKKLNFEWKLINFQILENQ